ncbi:MAG: 3-oxoacid CoA-transferase subunit B [Zoogloeaceae bacterium]|jgi:acetate CoA/acetoacetate CoA-transferase beta subunit|nr:3-oxoacid CoA-transferase subunit B [Zoogloeaceae bacterium]
MSAKEFIARRIALELPNGAVCNLGIGLPTMVANYLPPGVTLMLQSENGFLGIGPVPEEIPPVGAPRMVNAGGSPCSIIAGGSTFDTSISFALMRGGHLDACVLGGMQVDENADLANWMVPGKNVPGMGGAMDLVVGTKKVIIAMEHTSKGEKKILKKCTLPLTGKGVVSMIVTEMAVFRFIDGKLTLTEYAPGVSVEQITEATEAAFVVSPDLKEMVISQKGL